jgi:hypothetical protein
MKTKLRFSFCWGMYNWALTPAVSVWRNHPGRGIAVHFLRAYIAIYSSKR